MRVPKRKKEEERRLMQETDHYLTPQKITWMERELEDLIQNQRPKAADEVRRTAENGDFSENAEYQHAKRILRRINSRITSIQERLKYAIAIPEGSSDGIVQIGSTVTVRINNDRTMKFRIVGSSETNPAQGRISHSSPIGQALIGHRVGESVPVSINNREFTYDILEVT